MLASTAQSVEAFGAGGLVSYPTVLQRNIVQLCTRGRGLSPSMQFQNLSKQFSTEYYSPTPRITTDILTS